MGSLDNIKNDLEKGVYKEVEVGYIAVFYSYCRSVGIQKILPLLEKADEVYYLRLSFTFNFVNDSVRPFRLPSGIVCPEVPNSIKGLKIKYFDACCSCSNEYNSWQNHDPLLNNITEVFAYEGELRMILTPWGIYSKRGDLWKREPQ